MPVKKVEEKKTPAKKPAKADNKFNDLYKILSAPIPKEFLVSYNEDGKEFTGYRAQYAIDLLNEKIGMENVEIEEEILKEEMIGKSWFVAMAVDITISYEQKTIIRSGFGASYAKAGANAYKGAKTSAFKNACRFYGIGRELYVSGFDDEIPVAPQTGESKEAEKTPPTPEESETTGNAEELIAQIEGVGTKEALEQLRNTVSNFEAGDAVKKLLLKKFNDKLIAFDQNAT